MSRHRSCAEHILAASPEVRLVSHVSDIAHHLHDIAKSSPFFWSVRFILSKAYLHCAVKSPLWRISPPFPFSFSAPTPARKIILAGPVTVTASEKRPFVQSLYV